MAANITLSVFELSNDRGFYCPDVSAQFADPNSTSKWFVRAGDTRCYVVRARPLLEASGIDEETDAPLSHFMASRIVGGLFMARAGLFRPILRGRVGFKADEPFRWQTQISHQLYSQAVERVHHNADPEVFSGWLRALCTNTHLRRAIDDAILAIRSPNEALVFLHRGFEWIEEGFGVNKKEIAEGIGVSLREYKSLGRAANDETGIRHASSTGLKASVDLPTYASWAAGLVNCISWARNRTDSEFIRLSREECREIVALGIDGIPYP